MGMPEQNLAPIQQNYVPQIAVTPEQALHAYRTLQQITKEVLVKDTDYGIIPGTPKPTLLKPGAENLLRFYGLGHRVEKVHSIEDWEKGFFYFEFKVTVHKTFPDGTVAILSECVGSANSKEKRYRNQDPYMLVNTLQKMAIKRGLVGAALQATGASGLFTQDIEDMDFGDNGGGQSGGYGNGGGNRGNGGNRNNNSGGNNANPTKTAVMNKRTEMGLDWNQLADMASEALGRPIKKVIQDIQDGEWQTVLDFMNVIYNQAG